LVKKQHVQRILIEADTVAFPDASGDVNPVHLDYGFSTKTKFGKRIVHGMLLYDLISAVLGTQLPGPGTIYVSQEFNLKSPVYIGDTATALVEVINTRKDKSIYILSTVCLNQRNEVIIIQHKLRCVCSRIKKGVFGYLNASD